MIALKTSEKYDEIRENIRDTFSSSGSTYGYRRIESDMKKAGKTISEKVVHRLMKEENLLVMSVKRKKYNSYWEISPAVPNVIDRDFHEDEANLKWLTVVLDITEYYIPAGQIYFFPYNRLVSNDEFIGILGTYIHWYAELRIKMSLGGLSPFQYQKTLGYVA